jgi:peptidoglycan/LPS O-acetylase OafA/YrhL
VTSALQRVPGHRYAHIDALRGVAAAVVVWMHGSEVFVRLPGMDGRGAWLHEVADSVNLGRVGVVAFFLISGYVIPHSLQGQLGPGLRQFAIRRFFRLFPAFWLSIPLGYAAVWMLWQRPFGLGDVLANVTMVPAVFGREAAMGLYWTLETELVFYFLVTMLFVVGALRRPAVLASIAFALLAVFVLQGKVPWLPKPPMPQWAEMPFNLAVMLAGTLCRYASDDARRAGVSIATRRRADALAILAMAAVSALSAAFIVFGRSVGGQIFGVANLIGIALFLATLLFWRRPPDAVVWMGSISYSLYLLHPVVLYPLAWVLTYHVVWPAPLGVGSLLLVLGAGSVALAGLSYRWVELPAINLARRLTTTVRREPAAWPTGQSGRP